MSVNVNRSVTDQFYRYKMPRLIAKVGVNKKNKKSLLFVENKWFFFVFSDRWKARGMVLRL